MAYKSNLGRVKGEKGVTYTPQITIKPDTNGINKQYISWVSDDGSDIPEELAEKEFASKVYKPVIDENGNINFVLDDATVSSISGGNIKGPQGSPGHIDVEVVTSEPISGQEGTIYIYGENAYVFDENGNIHQIENMLKFNEYYTKSETYKKYNIGDTPSDDNTYSASYIDSKLGSIEDDMQKIQTMLDNGAINIPTDDT